MHCLMAESGFSNYAFLPETGFHYEAEAGLDVRMACLPSTVITGVCCHYSQNHTLPTRTALVIVVDLIYVIELPIPTNVY